MKFKIFMSSVKSEFAKARLAVMVFAASATLPIAAVPAVRPRDIYLKVKYKGFMILVK